MKKILMLVLFVSYVNAGPVITQEMMADSMLNGVSGVFKEITGQNDQAHEENCQIEYKKLYERNSKLLKKEKEENIQLKRIIRMNNIPYEEVKMDHLEIRKNEKCSIEYWDYFKSTNHDISQLINENRQIKIMLSKYKINYTPLLKRKTIVYEEKEVSKSEREKAKEELKRQMGF